MQCLHPVGHWFEFSSLFRNGVLRDLLRDRPQLRYLLAHNIDTTGVTVDAGLLGWHIEQVEQGAGMTFEVIDAPNRRYGRRSGPRRRPAAHCRGDGAAFAGY